MKTSELSGAALDWAVASLELTGHDEYTNVLMVTVGDDNGWKYKPSTDWAQGGAILEREKLCITPETGCWSAFIQENLYEEDGSEHYATGATPLIAAMRCYVASKMGNEINLPEEVAK
jgi:hypothetical protein